MKYTLKYTLMILMLIFGSAGCYGLYHPPLQPPSPNARYATPLMQHDEDSSPIKQFDGPDELHRDYSDKEDDESQSKEDVHYPPPSHIIQDDPIQVRGYYRKDGTYVRSHTRRR